MGVACCLLGDIATLLWGLVRSIRFRRGRSPQNVDIGHFSMVVVVALVVVLRTSRLFTAKYCVSFTWLVTF